MVGNALQEAWRRWETAYKPLLHGKRTVENLFCFSNHTALFTLMKYYWMVSNIVFVSIMPQGNKGLIIHKPLDFSSRISDKQASGWGLGVVVLRLHFWQVLRLFWCCQSLNETLETLWYMSAVVNSNMTKMFEAVHYAKSSTHCLCIYALR